MEANQDGKKTNGEEKPNEVDAVVEPTEEVNEPIPLKVDATVALQNEILYLKAEFDNTRKRMLKEQDQAIKFGNERLIRELVGVVDLLDRALSHGKTAASKPGAKIEADFTTLVNGVDMTQRELIQLLGRFGVEFTGTVGEKFDPSRHEAISQREAEGVEEGTIVDVLQKGCILLGRLLTPARVVVAKPGA